MIVIVRSLDRDGAARRRHPVWPLFDLRVRTPHLTLRVPGDGDLAGLVALAGRSGWSASGPGGGAGRAAVLLAPASGLVAAVVAPAARGLRRRAAAARRAPARGGRLRERPRRPHARAAAGGRSTRSSTPELLRGVLALAFEHLGALSARAAADDPPGLLERHGFTTYGVQRRLDLDGWLRLGDTGVEVDRLDRAIFGLAA